MGTKRSHFLFPPKCDRDRHKKPAGLHANYIDSKENTTMIKLFTTLHLLLKMTFSSNMGI